MARITSVLYSGPISHTMIFPWVTSYGRLFVPGLHGVTALVAKAYSNRVGTLDSRTY